jgi:hypothetical protein
LNTATLPEVVGAEQTADYDHRVLFLTGTWDMPNSAFRFRATIFVGKDGGAEGRIYWQAIRVHGNPASYFATEYVRGAVRGREVELEGYAVERGLARDGYKITLDGDGEAGPFGGITRTPLNNWCGRIGGRYLFKNRSS